MDKTEYSLLELLGLNDELLLAVLEEQRKTNHILRSLLYHLNKYSHNRVLGGVMIQKRTTRMVSIAPGNAPQFTVTPIWSDTPGTTLASATVWSSSDDTNFPVTMNATDPTGLSATVNIPTTATLGENVTLTWTYTNLDGSTATATGNFVDGVLVVSNVTGGVLSQSA